VQGDFHPDLWSHYDNNGPRTTNAAEGWHNSLNTHFGTPHPSLRVFLHWLAKCQFEVQSRCIQLAAGRAPKQQHWNYTSVNAELWNAKVRYGMDMGYIFAMPAADSNAIYSSRMQFRAVTESYLRRCSHLFGCN